MDLMKGVHAIIEEKHERNLMKETAEQRDRVDRTVNTVLNGFVCCCMMRS